MSWGINVIGKKEAVTKAVAAVKGYGDESQLDAAKAFIASELALQTADIGVSVDACGHHDSGGNRSLTIKIAQVHIAE